MNTRMLAVLAGLGVVSGGGGYRGPGPGGRMADGRPRVLRPVRSFDSNRFRKLEAKRTMSHRERLEAQRARRRPRHVVVDDGPVTNSEARP